MAKKGTLEKFVDATYQQLDQGLGAGIAVSVVSDDKVLLSKGYGLADRGPKGKKKVDEHTLFGIGSVSKPFASLSVMKLATDGVAALENPIRYYDPDFQLMDPLATDEASFVDLLAQRTGVPRNDGIWYLGGVPNGEIHDNLRFIPPDATPGKGFRNGFYYNNLVYSTVGVLIEKIEKVSWSTFLQRKIFDPIGMSSTNARHSGLKASKNWAKPYMGTTALRTKNMDNIAAAASINSNAVDMGKWLQVFLREGLLSDGSRLISKALAKQTRTRRVFDIYSDGKGIDYALGWFVSKAGRRDLVWCPGNADGYSAYASYMPSTGLGVVVLVNQHMSNVGAQLAAAIYQRSLGKTANPAPFVAPTHKHRIVDCGFAPQEQTQRTLIGHSSPPTGRFQNAAYGEIKVSKHGKKYRLDYGGTSYRLEPQPHGGYSFPVEVFEMTHDVPAVFTDDPVAGVCLSIPFEPTTGWVQFLKR